MEFDYWYSTLKGATNAIDMYKPDWLCPIDKNICDEKCYCYVPPAKFKDDKGWGIHDAKCDHMLFSTKGNELFVQVLNERGRILNFNGSD